MNLSTPIKQLIKDNFFLSSEEVDNIASIAGYAMPIQLWLNGISEKLTAYELNAALPLVQKYFAQYTHATLRPDGSLVLERKAPRYESLTLVPSRGTIAAYESIPHNATSNGMSRLGKS